MFFAGNRDIYRVSRNVDQYRKLTTENKTKTYIRLYGIKMITKRALYRHYFALHRLIQDKEISMKYKEGMVNRNMLS